MSRRFGDNTDERTIGGLQRRLGLILFLLIVGAVVFSVVGVTSTYSVGVSQSAVLVNGVSGEISGPVPGPTTHFFGKYPWVNTIIIPTSVQTLTLQGNSTGVFVLSQDNLEIEFDINFRYQVLSNHAIQLYEKFPGQNWEAAAIEPHIRTAFRDVVAKYAADQIQIVRDQIQTGVEQEISNNIGNDSSLAGAISVVSVQITDITLPASFLGAIQAKLNAQQQYLQAQFDAQKVVLLATANANATIQQALGVKSSQLIIANGTAASLQYIGRELNLNATQIAALTQTYVFMQQLQTLCQQSSTSSSSAGASTTSTSGACQNMVMILGSSNGQLIQIPVK
jgi:regulator of protease activity HflC (stomatin/prohibitin superfamily)